MLEARCDVVRQLQSLNIVQDAKEEEVKHTERITIKNTEPLTSAWEDNRLSKGQLHGEDAEGKAEGEWLARQLKALRSYAASRGWKEMVAHNAQRRHACCQSVCTAKPQSNWTSSHIQSASNCPP